MNESTSQKIKIAVIGAGGIGRQLATVFNEYSHRGLPYLSPTNLSFTWFDNDEVSEENVWTQGFTQEAADLIEHKVNALKAEFKNLLIIPKTERLEDVSKLDEFDYVFIACDNLPTRRAVYEYVLNKYRIVKDSHNTQFIDMRVNGTMIFVADSTCNHEELMESVAGGEGGDAPTSCLFQREKDAKIIHTTPMFVASLGVQYYLNMTRGLTNSILELNL